MLLLLLGGDVSLNPGPLTLGVLNARFLRNKGPLFTDIVTSVSLKPIFCPFDSDSFLQCITPTDLILPHRPCHSGIGGGVVFSLDPPTNPIK